MATPERPRGSIEKLLAHLRAGTLGDRLAAELQRWACPVDALRERAQRELAQAWKAVEGTSGWIDVLVIGGARLRLYGESVLGQYICRHSFEASELLFLHRYLRPSDVFVDVGANLGLFTVAAARRVGPAGRVLAFEPGSGARRMLEENVRLNRLCNTTILPIALSSSDARLTPTVPVLGHEAFGSLARPIDTLDTQTEEIEARAWDGLAQDLLGAQAVTMMKIDVEGWESHVLSGAKRFLSQPQAPLLQVEFTDAAAAAAGSSCAELYTALNGFGFEICRYDTGKNCLLPEDLRAEYPYVNLFATKDPGAVNERLHRAAVRPWHSSVAFRLLKTVRGAELPR